MSRVTFKSLFEGKQSKLEEKLAADDELLGKLQEAKIIKESQRQQIEVTLRVSVEFI